MADLDVVITYIDDFTGAQTTFRYLTNATSLSSTELEIAFSQYAIEECDDGTDETYDVVYSCDAVTGSLAFILRVSRPTDSTIDDVFVVGVAYFTHNKDDLDPVTHPTYVASKVSTSA